jgi:hypothetical protein
MRMGVGFLGNAVFGGLAGGFVTADGIEEFKKHGGASVAEGPGDFGPIRYVG